MKYLLGGLLAAAGVAALVASSNAQTAGSDPTMRERADAFVKDVRTKLDAADKRLKEASERAKTATEKAGADAKAELNTLEVRAKADLAKAEEAGAKAKAWLETKKATTQAELAEWKAKHDAKRLAAHANGAAQYAGWAMERAAAAVEEAERAGLEAIVLRFEADAAQRAVSGK